MLIETQATADPAVLRFLPGRRVLGRGTMEFRDREAAGRSPLAARLLDLPGVAAIAFGPDDITITQAGSDWTRLKPAVLGTLVDHFLSGEPVLAEAAASPAAASPAEHSDPRVRGVWDALHKVIDPELGFNIVDLGLIYAVAVDAAGAVQVTMTTTTPGCPATSYLSEGARQAALGAEGIAGAEVTLTWDPRWTPDRMSERARAHLGMGR